MILQPVQHAGEATAEMSAHIRLAADTRAPIRVVGSGTWLDAGRPVAAETVARASAGIVEYEPGDLTLTACAGTSLSDIARTTAEFGQWLTLDPFGSDVGTIGATIATASAGPLTNHFGAPRDTALGLEFVLGDGTICRGGGRVVKNVAGFDLTRLFTGSWGTLGVITEVTVRLRSRPEVDRTLAIPCDDVATTIANVWRWLRAVPFTPYALEILDRRLASTLDVGDRAALLVRLGGNDDAVRAQREACAVLGDVAEIEQTRDAWTTLRTVEPPGASVLRLSGRPSRFGHVWDSASRVAEAFPGALVHGTPARGIVRLILPRSRADHDTAVQHTLTACRAGPWTVACERLPESGWAVMSPADVANRISREIKAVYDPFGILNPGILGEYE